MKYGKRIVLDTSTLIGAVLRQHSIPRQVVIKALSEGDLCASASTLAELEEVICRDKFDRYLDLNIRLEFVAMYRDRVRMFQVSTEDEAALDPPCRDPRDNKFLALAVVSGADVLVSSDDDLLTLNPYGNISVLTPSEYLASVSAG
ncbi:MAG: putative toxin-antitoxin system toxin component, PIN family [Gallionella sp.]|jgi:putative PIN family toxin of toxin-antitoxin system